MNANTPEWVKHSVFYEIFVDRFARGKREHEIIFGHSNLEQWETPPTLHGYKGGNLWGVIDHFDYLQDLGINAIYFTPIFQATANHRYHIHDYYRIDPLLGGDEAFDTLLTEAHHRNIKIVLDGVFGHAGRGFFFANDILENGENSPWIDWLKIEGWPLSFYDQALPANYTCWQGHRALPQFNHNNPAVREYLMKVGEYWIKKGIDGWRLDSPDSVQTTGFWEEFCDRVKTINPDAYVFGEVVPTPELQFFDGPFDGVMNYRFRRHAIIYAASDYAASIPPDFLHPRGDIPAPQEAAVAYADKIKNLLKSFPCDDRFTQFNLLASHDTARPITTMGGDRKSLELATLLLLTAPGAPCIYYGDEVGLQGAGDPDCRGVFPSEVQWDRAILAFHQKLIALRHAYPAFRVGEYQPLLTQGETYVFARIFGDEELIVAVNADIRPIKVRVDQIGIGDNEGYSYTLKTRPSNVLYGSAEIHWTNEADGAYLTLALPPRSAIIVGPTAEQ